MSPFRQKEPSSVGFRDGSCDLGLVIPPRDTDGEPGYRLEASCKSVEEMRMLIDQAEPDGPVRERIKDVVGRTVELFELWQAEIKGANADTL